MSRAPVVLFLAAFLLFDVATASTLRVPDDHARVTDALAASAPGDTVRVAAGRFATSTSGEAFPLTMAVSGVTLLGAGAGSTILDAENQSSVLVLNAPGLRVSGFTITGGWANEGGGIRADAGAPEIDHNLLLENRATYFGAAIYVAPGADAWIHHNVSWRSMDTDINAYGDPHGIQIVNANGLVEHNLIGRGDSNGLITTGTAKPNVRNNIFFENGTPGLRGRGYCALSDTTETITHNVFFGNVIAALIVTTPTGIRNVSAAEANDYSLTDNIHFNLDADPLLVDPDQLNFHLEPGSPAIDAGDPAAGLDPDGTAPDAGPFYFDQTGVSAPPAPGRVAFLLPGAPNPFREGTTLGFTLPRAGRVQVDVFDLRGRLVAQLVDGVRPAGPSSVRWESRGAASGVYVARLAFEGATSTRKIVLAR